MTITKSTQKQNQENQKHPSKYPWTSCHYNGAGKADENITPHQFYLRLGKMAEDRQLAYRSLFKCHLSRQTLDEIRESTNKAWVLGDNRFKVQIEQQLNRRVAPLPRGGDRKSVRYLDSIK